MTPDLEVKISKASETGLEIKKFSASWPRSAFAPPGTIVTADMVNGWEVFSCPKEQPDLMNVEPVYGINPPSEIRPKSSVPVQNLPAPASAAPPATEPAKAAGSTNAKTAWVVGGVAAAGAVAAYFGMK